MSNTAVNLSLPAYASRARWRGVALAAGGMRGWLTDRGSLTLRLKQTSKRFQVVRLAQGRSRVCIDEAACLVPAAVRSAGKKAGRSASPRTLGFLVREVLLECDGRPTVFAHSVIDARALAGGWRWLAGLGTRPLGEALFSDPRVRRGPLAFRQLRAPDPRYLHAASALAARGLPVPSGLWARRSVFSAGQWQLLVTEVFLPAVADLEAARVPARPVPGLQEPAHYERTHGR
jgi:chorismate--pyruvate lyase